MTDDKKGLTLDVTTTGITTTYEVGSTWTTNNQAVPTPSVPGDVFLPEVTEPKLVILKYEFEMYFSLRCMAESQWALRNAITESAAVHARNLCNFFCDSGKKGDIQLQEIFDIKDRKLSSLQKDLRKAYNTVGKASIRPRDAFSKLVAHMTSERKKSANGYDYHEQFSAIDPILRQIRDEIVRPFFCRAIEVEPRW
jgi:hypothetical protein